MRTTDKYIFFWNGIYSQWYPSTFVVDGVTFVTAEQFMMYQKALTFNDEKIAAEILLTSDPKEQKSLGRQIQGFDVAVWNKVSLAIVYKGNLAKFSQNEDLKSELLASGERVLVEASPVDNIWGVGLHEDDDRIDDPANWQGLNLLGSAVMLVRNTLRDELQRD